MKLVKNFGIFRQEMVEIFILSLQIYYQRELLQKITKMMNKMMILVMTMVMGENYMKDLLYKSFNTEIKEIDEQDRSFWAIASTGDVDRHGDIIDPNGWILNNYKKNPIILWAHNHSDLPVAKAEKIKVEDNKLVFKAKFATYEEYPFADTIFKLFKGGFLKSFSVGFISKESQPRDVEKPYDGRNITKQELYEIS